MANPSTHVNGSISRSNNNTRPSDDEYDNLSDIDTARQQKPKGKQKNVRIAKYDSSGRTISQHDEHDNGEQNLWPENDEDLYTVREEKTLESFENARYKKR